MEGVTGSIPVAPTKNNGLTARAGPELRRPCRLRRYERIADHHIDRAQARWLHARQPMHGSITDERTLVCPASS